MRCELRYIKVMKKIIYSISANQVDKTTPPLSPWVMARIGMYLTNKSIPPADKGEICP